MAPNDTSLVDYYLTDAWNLYGDPRTAAYPLMSTFKLPLAIYLAYLFTVLYLGPRLMRHREPFNLRLILIPYNLLLSLANLIFFIDTLLRTGFGSTIQNVTLHPTDDTSPEVLGNIARIYAYLLTKYLDKLDTVFFVLKKKDTQVTALHVYHHSTVPLFGWIYFRANAFNATADAFTCLNTPLHTLMYAYYGLAAIGPHMQPYLWWKKYLTQLQILQFALLFAFGLYFTLFQSGHHPFYSADILLQTALYFILFTRFYLKSYQGKASICNDTGKKKE